MLSAEEAATLAFLAARRIPLQALAFSLFSLPKVKSCTLIYSRPASCLGTNIREGFCSDQFSRLRLKLQKTGGLLLTVPALARVSTRLSRSSLILIRGWKFGCSAPRAAGICLLLVLLKLAKLAA